MSFSPVESFKLISKSHLLSPHKRAIKKQESGASRFKSPISACSPRSVKSCSTPVTRFPSKAGASIFSKNRIVQADALVAKSLFVRKHRHEICGSPEGVSCNTPDRFKIHHKMDSGHDKNSLGKGAYGTVIRGKYKDERIAVKFISKPGCKSLKNEANAVALSHPNIVKLLKVISEEEYGLILMERIFGPNLQDLLLDANVPMKASDKASYMLNIADALEYCHCQEVLHLDVKPKNILLCTVTNTCKLCDFGSSVKTEELLSCPAQTKIGMNTLGYTDPQIFLGKLPTKKADVYSFGITMWQMISRKIPYEGENDHFVIYRVVSRGYRPEEVKGVTEQDENYIYLFKWCWKAEPMERPDMSTVVERLRIIVCNMQNSDESLL